MRTITRWFRSAVVLVAATLTLASCVDRVFTSRAQGVELNIVLASQVTAARSVTVRVRYETSGGGLVTILDQVSSVATGTQQLSVPVDISKCLADAAHVGGPTVCRLRVLVELRDGPNGSLLDSAELPPIDASPGAAPTAATVTVAAVNSVAVSGVAGSLIAGQTAQAAALVKDASGNTLTRPVAWSSTAPTVATVSTSGLVTAIAAGSTQIVAASGGVVMSTPLTVLAAVATVTVTPTSQSLFPGNTVQLTATTRDAANNILTGRAITYSSGSGGVASVSATGLVTAIAAGTTIITVSSEGRTATATITVTNPPPPPPPPPTTLTSVGPTSLSGNHTVGGTSCPQSLGTVTVTNVSGVALTWTASTTHPALNLSASGTSIAAGGTGQLTVAFNCVQATSFSTTITIMAQTAGAGVVESRTVTVILTVVNPDH